LANPPRILVAPLNWGLGHATRCIPLIETLLAQGAEVLLASDGVALDLLKKEYPHLPTIELPSYNIYYHSENMIWNMALQWPKMMRAIRREHQELKSLVRKEAIDLIISDNRYGCFHPSTKNIFLSHQLNLKVPTFLLRTVVNQVNRLLLKPFDEIWVPDLASSPNLSGDLSHPSPIPKVHYLGLLSRMRYAISPKKYDLAIVLSGPEPQRTYLEEKIINQIQHFPEYKIILVQGSPNAKPPRDIDHLECVAFLTSRELNKTLLAADLIICRSGYSSLMDLAKLRRKALLIPTPGQTEQEYLAKHLKEQGFFFSTSQESLTLKDHLPKARQFSGFPENYFSHGDLEQKITKTLELLVKSKFDSTNDAF